jgi:hypothetical protein
MRLDDVPRAPTYFLAKKDESLLFVLEDICEGSAHSRVEVQPSDFINLLNLHTGKPLPALGREEPITVNGAPMSSQLKLNLDNQTGELVLTLHTELPFQDGQAPLYVVSGKAGWVYGAGHFWPLAQLLPGPLRMVYQGPVRVPRAAVPRFLQTELPLLSQHMTVVSDVTLDLFTIEPGTPKFRLAVKGSPASLAAVLYAEYGEVTLVAGKQDAAGHFSHPDPDDLLRFHVRHPVAEAHALARLAGIGLKGATGDQLAPLVGCREVLNFLGRDLPALRRAGWKIDLEGKLSALLETTDFVTPVVHVNDRAGGNWFDVSFDFDDGQGGSLSPGRRAARAAQGRVLPGAQRAHHPARLRRHPVHERCVHRLRGRGGQPGRQLPAGRHLFLLREVLPGCPGRGGRGGRPQLDPGRAPAESRNQRARLPVAGAARHHPAQPTSARACSGCATLSTTGSRASWPTKWAWAKPCKPCSGSAAARARRGPGQARPDGLPDQPRG